VAGGVSLLAACDPGEVRVAAWRDNGLVDYAIWRPGAPDGVGDVHRGRVVARVPALGGAFVAIEGTEGFLPDSAGTRPLAGDAVAVRVVRAAQGGKGPRLAPAGRDAGTGPVALLERGPGPLAELAARYPEAPVVLDDAVLVPGLRPPLGDRLRLVRCAWDDAVEAAASSLAEPEAILPGGARMIVHPTPALVAIDIDTASTSAVRAQKAAAQMATNLAVLPGLAAQIRLRNLSGAILVDFAGLPARKRAALRPELAQALASDPLAPRLLGFTALGLAEIVRPRIRPPLHELLAGPLAAGLAALRQIAARLLADPAWRPALRAAPMVVGALQADPVALPALAARAGRSLVLRSDPSLAGTATIIEEAT
jgi:hypothetical protein